MPARAANLRTMSTSRSRLPPRAPVRLLLAAAWMLPSVAGAQAAEPLQARIEQAARAWLGTRLEAMDARGARIAVALLPAARRMPDCAQPPTLEIGEVPAGERFDRLQVLARCPATGGEARFVVRASALASGLVARTAVAAGQPLAAAAVETAEQDLAAVPDLLLSVDQLQGQTSRRGLRPGQPVRRSALQGASAVARGQPVRIVGGGPGFQVAVAGTALEDGAAGDSVRVRNASTGKSARARVLGPGLVSLEAPP